MSNLQREIRGDTYEVASRRGFVAGISETRQKYMRPHVKSSFSSDTSLLKVLFSCIFSVPTFIFKLCVVLLWS